MRKEVEKRGTIKIKKTPPRDLSGHQKNLYCNLSSKGALYKFNNQLLFSTKILNKIIEDLLLLLLRYNYRDLHVLKHSSILLLFSIFAYFGGPGIQSVGHGLRLTPTPWSTTSLPH